MQRSHLALVPQREEPLPQEPARSSGRTGPGVADGSDPDHTEVQRVARLLVGQGAFRHLANSLEEPLVVLGAGNRIVLANERLAELVGVEPPALLGLRLGEALSCLHSTETPAGCGTTEACLACGACQAIAASQERGREVRRDCRLQTRAPGGAAAMDLKVRATPLPIEGEELTIVALSDATDQHRRRVLERLFFHDVLNTAGAVHGLLRLLPLLDEEDERQEVLVKASKASEQLLEEVLAQRDLTAAERGELTVRRADVDVGALMARICLLYSGHAQVDGKRVASPHVPPNERLVTDELLLRRVLSNLVKNALEASTPGGAVRFAYRRQGARALFTVHNDGAMPEAVKHQVFQRSFSTKEGRGRGLGTYSVRLLTERYLGGSVRFASEAETGTTFTVELPAEG